MESKNYKLNKREKTRISYLWFIQFSVEKKIFFSLIVCKFLIWFVRLIRWELCCWHRFQILAIVSEIILRTDNRLLNCNKVSILIEHVLPWMGSDVIEIFHYFIALSLAISLEIFKIFKKFAKRRSLVVCHPNVLLSTDLFSKKKKNFPRARQSNIENIKI